MTRVLSTPALDAAKGKKSRTKPKRLPPALLSRVEAAAYLGISASTLDRLNLTGELPAGLRLGGRLLWCRFELSVWTAYGCVPRETWRRLWVGLRDRAGRGK